jgi:threonine dehydrogenase-like Zn-dependent dehydrogenase
VQALVTTPGEAHSTRVEDVPDALADGGAVLLRTLAIGVCGTDREIAQGVFGEAPEGERDLVLGHEFLGRVERDGAGLEAGALVAGTVRRSCRRCIACEQGAPDACLTGDYRERGITRLHGYASELVAEAPEHLIAVPASLGHLGVLAEPGSICARALRHVDAIGTRQPWAPERALVLGPGAIGMLATFFLRLRGLATWTAGRSPAGSDKARLVEAVGATYVSTEDTPLSGLVEATGGFDVVIEATGDAQVMLDSARALRRNGVACLLGIDGHPREVSIDGRVLGVDFIVQNRALFGSVNANRVDWLAAVGNLGEAHRRWPDALESVVGLRVGVDAFAEAFAFRGVKATLTFGAGA